MFTLEGPEQVDALLVHGIEAPAQGRLEKLFLAAKMVVNRGQIHTRGPS